jgi:hypothetical protein
MWKVVKQQLQALPQNLPSGIEEEEADEEKKTLDTQSSSDAKLS